MRFDDILGSDDPVADPNKYSDISMLIYTGGTTGPSKGCIISHNYVCDISRNAVIDGERTKDDISWSPLPLFHRHDIAATVLASALTISRARLSPRFSVTRAEDTRSGKE